MAKQYGIATQVIWNSSVQVICLSAPFIGGLTHEMSQQWTGNFTLISGSWKIFLSSPPGSLQKDFLKTTFSSLGKSGLLCVLTLCLVMPTNSCHMMAEPRFNNPYFWPPPPTMPSQLDNLVLINKIKEQLMAEKIRPPHLPPTSASSQQPLLVPPAPAESSQAVMSLPKLQQVPGLHPQAVPQPDVALHARPATSTVTGLGLSSRTPTVSTSESSTGTGTGTSTPSTPTTTSQSRLIASSPTLISGITSPPLLDSIKTIQGHGLLGPPKSERGRKKIKAENPGGPPVLVVPYPILASGETAKEGKTYRCKVCPLTFFTKSEMQIHSKSHTEAKPHKCPHCSKSFANASYLAQHLRIHLGVKPYHCSYCDKSFRQLSHLQQHTSYKAQDATLKPFSSGVNT
ncbi:zinc finger protein 362 isoform X4 [Marmota flaviventris]|uniref:zinc finger protein 362 isoform X4 n=1 Tax=Marmota flaviventris TaxID=93162 RepID=UPI003A8B3DF1